MVMAPPIRQVAALTRFTNYRQYCSVISVIIDNSENIDGSDGSNLSNSSDYIYSIEIIDSIAHGGLTFSQNFSSLALEDSEQRMTHLMNQ